MISNRKIIFICFGLFLLNFILKILFISYHDVGLDEPFSIFHSQRSLHDIFEMLKNENNPPLYYILLHYWIKLFGIEPFFVRLPSVIFSSLSAVVIFLIGKEHFSLKTGIISSLIFTAATDHYYYAHDARVYALFYLLTCLNLYYFLRIISDPEKINSKYNYVTYIFLNILLCYSHYFGFVVIVAELTICIFLSNRKKYLPGLLISFISVLISYAWYFPILAKRFIFASGGTWVQKPEWIDLYTMLWRFGNVHLTAIIMIAIIIIGLYKKRNQFNYSENTKFKIITLLFFFTYFGLFMISFYIPIFIDRYLLFTSLFFYLLASISLTSISEKQNLTYIFSGITIFLMFLTVELKNGKKIHIKELTEYVRPLTKNSKTVFIYPEWADYIFVYHYNRRWFADPVHLRDTLKSNSIIPISSPADIKNNLNSTSFILVNASVNDTLLNNFLLNNYSMQLKKYFGVDLCVQVFNANKN